MSAPCASDRTRKAGVRCTKPGRYPAAVQSTVDAPDPLPVYVCWHHRDRVVPPRACPCCGRP